MHLWDCFKSRCLLSLSNHHGPSNGRCASGRSEAVGPASVSQAEMNALETPSVTKHALEVPKQPSQRGRFRETLSSCGRAWAPEEADAPCPFSALLYKALVQTGP